MFGFFKGKSEASAEKETREAEEQIDKPVNQILETPEEDDDDPDAMMDALDDEDDEGDDPEGSPEEDDDDPDAMMDALDNEEDGKEQEYRSPEEARREDFLQSLRVDVSSSSGESSAPRPSGGVERERSLESEEDSRWDPGDPDEGFDQQENGDSEPEL